MYDQPVAVANAARGARRALPGAPIFIVSDGGMDASRLCATLAPCEFSWRPPANDRINPVPFLDRFMDAIRWLGTEFVVMLEPDVVVHRAPSRPPRDAGGVRDVWNRMPEPVQE